MSDPRDRLRLADIDDQIDYIATVIATKSEADFLNDRTLHQSVSYSLQVIGEVANNLSDEARQRAHDVPWPKIIALRNRIVHSYFALELTEIWRIASSDVPALKASLINAGLLP